MLAIKGSLTPSPTGLDEDTRQVNPKCPLYLKYWVRQKDSTSSWVKYPIPYEDYCTGGNYGCPVCTGNNRHYTQADYDCSQKKAGCHVVSASLRQDGELCSNDSDCAGNVCGNIGSGPYEVRQLICCPSGAKTYAAWPARFYCTGMHAGQYCWQDAQCTSGNCKGNAYGFRTGTCQ